MRILIVKLSAIGDVVHTLPAAAFLKSTFPQARITWVVDRRAGAILHGSPAIDELIEIDTRRWRKHMFSQTTQAELKQFISGLRDDPIDVAIDFQGLIKSGLVAWASRARRRIGFETAELREPASRIFLTRQIATSAAKHIIDKNLQLARAAAQSLADEQSYADEGRPYQFPIASSSEDEDYARKAADRAGGGFALLNPGGGWPTKLWPAERYGEIADWLWKEKKLPSYVTFGPGEEHLAKRVQAGSTMGMAEPITSTIKQFVALARRATVFIGGDTGPLHIAAACGTPIVGLYGPTSPERNGPFNPADITVGLDLWCRPACHKRSCWHWQCMDIPVQAVARAVSERLARALKPQEVGVK